GGACRLVVGDLGEHDHVDVVTESAPHGGRHVRRVDTNLALDDHGVLVRVQHLYRVLDGEDGPGVVAVDPVDDRRDRGGLAGAGRAGDEHETRVGPGHLLGDPRQSEIGEGAATRDHAAQ